MKRKILVASGLLLALLVAGFFLVLPRYVGAHLNPVTHEGPYSAMVAARDLHQRLQVADLHADSLLWQRDLLQRSHSGQVDVPRLIEGNVALQAFTIVSKMPRNANLEHNGDDTDSITLMALAARWPWPALDSLTERALFQAHKLADFANRSEGRLTLIQDRAGLDKYLARRQREPHITAGFLGIEGAHALDGKLENIDRLYDAGVRMMSPSHFFDNDIGGSAHGMLKPGLSDKGKAMIRRMEAKKMLLDLAHAAPQTIDDALAITTRPVLVSHTGVKGTCNNTRNLSDQQLRAIAATGGLVGIGYWPAAVCGNDAAAVARAILYAVRVAGVEHVALGSDFDGSVTMPFDVSGLVLVTEALQKQGMSDADLTKVMGGNVLRLLQQTLP